MVYFVLQFGFSVSWVEDVAQQVERPLLTSLGTAGTWCTGPHVGKTTSAYKMNYI